jgi:hypothetical protein
MRIIGCDLHARQQTIAMLDTDTGEFVEKTLEHDGEELRKFYSGLTRPVLVGIEATGSMQWFLRLMEELGIECRVGHPKKIRKAETRKQKYDRRDTARGESLSYDLDAFDRATRSAHFAAASSSMVAHAKPSPTHPAIHGAREWLAAGPLLVEPGRPTRTPGVAPGSPCEPTKDRFAEFVSTLPGIDR